MFFFSDNFKRWTKASQVIHDRLVNGGLDVTKSISKQPAGQEAPNWVLKDPTPTTVRLICSMLVSPTSPTQILLSRGMTCRVK